MLIAPSIRKWALLTLINAFVPRVDHGCPLHEAFVTMGIEVACFSLGVYLISDAIVFPTFSNKVKCLVASLPIYCG